MNDADIGLIRRKGKIGGFCLYIGHTIEDGGFAGVGNPDYTALQTHDFGLI
jgi:hypothetical protein